MTTFVLLPGAGGDSWYWHRVTAELRRRGHDAIPVDLPAADDTAGLAEYVEVVVSAAADRGPLVLVAQSMGGLTAPLVCDRLPVELLVLVNAMIPRPGETGADWWTATGQGAAAARHAATLGLGDLDEEAVFLHDMPAELMPVLATRRPDQSGRPFEDPWPLRQWPAVPTRVLAGREDRLFPLDFQRCIAAERLGAPVEDVPGGHLVALSRPVELTRRLVAAPRPPE